MSFTICRVEKLVSLEEIRHTEIHNFRQYEERGIELPDNIFPEKEGILGYNSYEMWMEGTSMEDALMKRLEKLKVKPRSDSVLAHEYVLGLSKDWYEKANYSAPGMLANLLKFISNRYGPENIISIADHFDESTPHIHIIVIPLVLKERKWKNKNGSGSKVSYGLSAHDFIDGKDTLTQLQTDFFEFARQWDRGDAHLYRGLKAEEQAKGYTKKTNHLLGELRDLNRLMTKLIANINEGTDIVKSKEELKRHKIKYDELNQSIDKQQQLLTEAEKEIARRKKHNKNGGWKKGMDF